ncbi:MAG TPA: hypothetical protein VHA74_02235 [Candidatus Dojkabacteria bacterium]|nr:hypothetical protein [Candidatus Dojkabacteria bacterium]
MSIKDDLMKKAEDKVGLEYITSYWLSSMSDYKVTKPELIKQSLDNFIMLITLLDEGDISENAQGYIAIEDDSSVSIYNMNGKISIKKGGLDENIWLQIFYYEDANFNKPFKHIHFSTNTEFQFSNFISLSNPNITTLDLISARTGEYDIWAAKTLADEAINIMDLLGLNGYSDNKE